MGGVGEDVGGLLRLGVARSLLEEGHGILGGILGNGISLRDVG